MRKTHLIPLTLLGLCGAGFLTISKITSTSASSILASKLERNVEIASANDGGRLAKALQGKPVLVDIYATWCGGCQLIKPTLTTLEKQYSGKVNFVVFDVTDKKTTEVSLAKAQKLGLSDFFVENKSKTSTVAIMNPATGETLKLYQANPTLNDYKAVLDSAIAQIH
jgi:thiol-disulfide isomerase/thioredoxin